MRVRLFRRRGFTRIESSLGYILALLFMLVAQALADVGQLSDECLPDRTVCTGDSVFLDKGGSITYASVRYLPAGLQRDRVASVRHSVCASDKGGESICPGTRVRSAGERGIVLGVFPDQSVVLSVSSKALQRIPANQLSLIPYRQGEKQELAEAALLMGQINMIVNAEAPRVECGSEIPGVPPEKESKKDSLNCDDPSGPVSADDSPNKEYFEKLLARGMNASLEEFLRLWYPQRGEAGVESPFFLCESEPEGAFTRDGIGEWAADSPCRPETFYSWGPWMKISGMQKDLPDGGAWKGGPNSSPYGRSTLFTTISPVSTFGFGPYLLRVKAKKQAKFFSGEEKQGQIGVRQDKFHDFRISDAASIEGWAFGVPEMYDEVVRDIIRFRENKRAHIYTTISRKPGLNGLDLLWNQATDYHRQDEEALKMNLLELIRQILMEEGRIHYAAGACRNRELFFSAEKPTYFNPVRLKK